MPDDRLHGIGPLRGEHQGQAAPHAEPDDPDLLSAGPPDQLVHGTAQVPGRRLHPDAIISLPASSGSVSGTVLPW